MLSKRLVRHTHMLCESRRSVSLSQWRSPARPSRSCLGACQSRAQKTENARGLLLNLSPSVSSQLSPCNKLRQRRQWHPTPVLENPMGGGAWWAAVHGVAKSRTRLSDFPFPFHFHALEKEMATPSSVLAWRIPGTGEPGGLPSVGSHRVGHD